MLVFFVYVIFLFFNELIDRGFVKLLHSLVKIIRSIDKEFDAGGEEFG